MRPDGRGVVSCDRPGERLGRSAVFERLERAARERQERRARDRLGRAGRVLEGLDGAGEQRHLPARAQHRRRVIEGARAVAHRDGRHPQRAREVLQRLARGSVRAGDPGGRIAQDVRRAAARNGPQRMQRAGARAGVDRGAERRKAQRARAVRDELAAPEQGSDSPADLLDRSVVHGEEHQLRLAQPLQIGVPARLLGAVPGQDDADAGPAQSGDQHLADGAAA